jgi:small subunit ribosomal protein S17
MIDMKKNIGIDVKPPEGSCSDPKCPWHGRLAVRGRVFRGVVRSAKPHKTVIVEWKHDKFIRKYERYERRKSRVIAHNPACIRAKEADGVIIAECRPLSKTKRFVVVAKMGEGFWKIRGEEQKVLMKERKGKAEGEASGGEDEKQ